MMRSYIEFILRFRWPVVILVTIATVFLSYSDALGLERPLQGRGLF